MKFSNQKGFGGMGNFDLIETMRFDPTSGITRLELHLMRMKESANILGFTFDRHEARNQLHAAIFTVENLSKVRLLASRSGALSIEISDIPEPKPTIMKVGIAPMSVTSQEIRLAHKTSDREIYDAPRRAKPNWDEVIFTDTQGYLTEGSYTTLFVEQEGQYITPPLSRGLLPGILRREMIEMGRAIEGDLMEKDLSNGFFVGNSLRGLMKAKLFVNP